MNADAEETPWRGRWVRIEDPPADVDDLVLAVATRRGTDPADVERELRAIGEQLEVDAAYLAPE